MKEVYVLQVTGDAMKDEHIIDGDYVMVERGRNDNLFNNGEIVVVTGLFQGHDLKTAKMFRIYKEGATDVSLRPSNSEMKPIIMPKDAINIEGRVIGVLRKY